MHNQFHSFPGGTVFRAYFTAATALKGAPGATKRLVILAAVFSNAAGLATIRETGGTGAWLDTRTDLADTVLPYNPLGYAFLAANKGIESSAAISGTIIGVEVDA